MKLKKLGIWMAAWILLFVQLSVPAFADTDTPNGDWLDISALEPAETLPDQTTKVWGDVMSQKDYTDVLLECDWLCTGSGMQMFFYTRWSKNESGSSSNYLYFNAGEKQVHRLVQKDGKTVVNDGLLDRKDADYPEFTSGDKYRIRVQMQGQKISCWTKNLSKEENFRYAGDFSSNSMVKDPGKVILTFLKESTVENVKIYSLRAEMNAKDTEIMAKPGTKLTVEMSSELTQVPAAGDFVVKTADGTVIDVIGAVEASGKEYTITLKDWLEYDSEYTVELIKDCTTVEGFPAKGASAKFRTQKMPKRAAVVEDIAVSGDTVTAVISKNYRQPISGTAVCAVYQKANGAEILVDMAAKEFSENDSFNLSFEEMKTGEYVRIYLIESPDAAFSLADPMQK